GGAPPGVVAAGLVAAGGCRGGDDVAEGAAAGGERSGRLRLDEEVAERRRLHRTRDHREGGRVRGEAAQQLVAGPAADDVDHLGVAPRELRGLPYRPAVGEGEGVEDAPDEPGPAL